MADKLTYKGGARVVNQSGTGIQLVQPKKGPLHRFPRWWNRKGSVAYVDAAIFRVTLDSGVVVRLVVPATVGAHTLEIRHDGYGNFTFPVKNGIDRVAVITETGNTLYREYQFAKISGGSVLTRTLNPYPVPNDFDPATKDHPEPEPKTYPEAETVVEEAPKPSKKRRKRVTAVAPSPDTPEETPTQED